MEPKNREKMLLMAVGACVVLYLANLLIVSPLSNGWSARQDEIKKLKSTIDNGRMTIASAASIESNWSRMASNTLSANPTLAESQLFNAFQGWASSNNVVLVAQRPQAKPPDDPLAGYSTEEWHADVTGTLTQIFNFLYAVESSPMGLKVDSIELASRDDRGLQLALGLTVSGLILNPPTNNAP
jgi:hypothetical protein